ncbi:MAG: CARDB domain-containing protein [Candidatus Thermoplasmatota archaeon]
MRRGYALLLALSVAVSGALALLPLDAEGAYSLSIKGDTKFVAEPWKAQVFDGFVIVGLSDTAQSQLQVSMSVGGEIAQWLTWTTTPTFTLYPGQERTLSFNLSFPAMPPGAYTGAISAIGIPPEGGGGGGAVAPGNVIATLGSAVNVPALVYLSAYGADPEGAYATVANFAQVAFNGTVFFNLTHDDVWDETLNRTADMPMNSTLDLSVRWSGTTRGTTYDVLITLWNGTVVDEKSVSFRVPTPADIEAVWHEPDVVYADTNATLYATVHEPMDGQTRVTMHYRVDSGAERTGDAIYEPGDGRYSLFLPNTTYYEGAVVRYWATSYNDAYGEVYTDISVEKWFLVYSNRAPDLRVLPDEVYVLGPDPQNIREGQTITIRALVHNVGRGAAENFYVTMVVDDAVYRNQTMGKIGPGDHAPVDFPWAPQTGNYTVEIVADYTDLIVETNEDNNYASIQVMVHPRIVPPAPPEEEPTTDPLAVLAFIAGAVIILIAFLLLRRRKRRLHVQVQKVRRVERPDGGVEYRYVCTDHKGNRMGTTKNTAIEAKKGDVIEVKVDRLVMSEGGEITWHRAEVTKVMPEGAPLTDYREMVRMLR